MITAMPLCMQAGLAGGACDRSCKDFDREGKQKSEIKPSVSDALAARGKRFPARCYLRSRPRFDETIASRGGGFLHHAGVAVGYDWQIGRALLTLYAMGFYYSLTSLSPSRCPRTRACPLASSRGTPQLGETYRDVRLVLRSAPVACRRLGGFATGRLLTMAWWAVGGGALSFDRTNACTWCRRPLFERGIRLTGPAQPASQPCVVTRRRRTLSCELCAQERRRIIDAAWIGGVMSGARK